MSTINEGWPAFPAPEASQEHFGTRDVYMGMTLRDYFAAAAMQGLLSNPKLDDAIRKGGGANGGWIEESAWAWADGMLKHRGGQP